jgi:O-antigen/teichoic acid export membrane protein
LARLLAPELFGMMVLINSVKTGIALFGDFGFGQNIVYNKNGGRPDFYNTVWTLELARSVVLCLICIAASASLADLYESPLLAWVFPVSAMTFLLTGLSSISRQLLQKRMELAKLNKFEMSLAFIGSAAQVLFAFISPTIWALVLGGLFDSALMMIATHFLIPGVKQRLLISKQHVREILTFGKWIVVSSLVFFLSMHYDRLYLPTVIPLDVVGVYGIARAIAGLVTGLTGRLANVVVFPLLTSHSQMPRGELRRQLVPIRATFLLAAAFGISVLVAMLDLVIAVLYDERYQAAGWMLPILVSGSWFAILATINDSIVVGLGKPAYSAISNAGKLAFLAAGLPLGFALGGVTGVVLVVALSDACRYFPILLGQRREGLSFGMQDLLLTIAVFGLIAIWELLRWSAGYGTSFDTF